MSDFSYADWRAKAKEISPRTQAFIDGRFVDAASGKTWQKFNPATNQVIADVAECDAEDIDRAVQSARAAFDDGRWADQSPAARKKVLLRFSELMYEHAEELALLDSLDMGKCVGDAHQLDIPFSADLFAYYAEAIDKITGEVVPTAPGVSAQVVKVPLGVVGAVTPWNYPVDMAAWKVAPALAAGNSVVLKPAEQSPLSALRLAELLSEAGLPDGVFNVVPGFGPTAGQALGRHMDVDCLVFTGSTDVGKLFQRYAGESNMKQVWLECGGKSSNVVFADCGDLDAVAEATCADIFFNQGEVCSVHSRLLVDASIHDALVEKIVAIAARYQPGDPLDPASGMGSMVDAAQTDRVMAFIEQAAAESTLVAGGNRITIGGSDCFVEPTVFDDVHNDSDLAQNEVFGPVLAITTFTSEEEAVRFANSTEFALAASVWTQDISRANRMSRALNAGTVSVNCVDAFSAQTPFGGFKSSGYGRDLSLHALDKFTGLKTIWTSYHV